MTRTQAPHPHKPAEKQAHRAELRRQADGEAFDKIDDTKTLMSTGPGRRDAYRLLWEGLRIPGQRVSNANGSLQSYQLGRNDALREFDDRIRMHCNDLWLLMLSENHTETEQ